MKMRFVLLLVTLYWFAGQAFGECEGSSLVQPAGLSIDSKFPVEKRALIIGVSEYAPGIDPIPHAMVDVDLMVDAIEEFGLKDDHITPLRNPSSEEMYDAVTAFACSINPGDVAIVYYSGHGQQNGEQNYLFGTNSKLRDDGCRDCDTVPIEHILQELSPRRPSAVVLVLDACRTNAPNSQLEASLNAVHPSEYFTPALLTTSYGEMTLVQAQQPNEGLTLMTMRRRLPALYMFAAQPNEAALFRKDRASEGSIFTKHLATAIKAEKDSIQKIYATAQTEVEIDTGGDQIPHMDPGTVSAKLYMSDVEDAVAERDLVWERITTSGDSIETLAIRMYRFLRQHPASPYEYFIRVYITANRHRLSPNERKLVSYISNERLAQPQITYIDRFISTDDYVGRLSRSMQRELLEEQYAREISNEEVISSADFQLSWSDSVIAADVRDHIQSLSNRAERVEMTLELNNDAEQGAVFDARLEAFLATIAEAGIQRSNVRTYAIVGETDDATQSVQIQGFTEDFLGSHVVVQACAGCRTNRIASGIGSIFTRPAPDDVQVLGAEVAAQNPASVLEGARAQSVDEQAVGTHRW